MSFLIFLFAITLFAIVSVNLQAQGFILHPFVTGLIILAGSIFLTIFIYLKLKK